MDYTKARKSKIIRVCPKCQRKGRVTEGCWTVHHKTKEKITWTLIVHRTEETLLGMVRVVDSCDVDMKRTPLEAGQK